MRVYLVGFMGSGKSFAGKRLAEKLGLSFVDLDTYIEENECCNISDIFQHRGEQTFRSLESYYLNEFTYISDVLVSTGGGTPCTDNNMERMNETGVTIYLKTDPVLLASRLKSEKDHRPLLADKSDEELLDFITSKIEEREQYYSKATIIYNQTENDVDIADKLVELVKGNS